MVIIFSFGDPLSVFWLQSKSQPLHKIK